MFGADEQTIADAKASGDAELFEIWPENRLALDIFLRLGEAWTVLVLPGAVHYQGVRPDSIEAVMRVCSVRPRDRQALFDDVRAMTLAALEVLND